MQSVPTWLLWPASILGLVLGVSLTVLTFYLSRQFRHHQGVSKLPHDLEQTLENIPLLAVIFDRSLRPVAMNKLAQREPVKLAILQETLWFPSYLREASLSRRPLIRPSNEDDPFWVHIFALEDGRVVTLIADEHEKHDTETLRREFITNASHELNTPVAAISLLSEAIAQADGDTERLRAFATSLVGEVERLSALTRDIAKLSEAQTGWEDDELHLVDLAEVAHAVVADHANLAAAHRVDLTVKGTESGASALVRGHERSLMVAVTNLVENAIQHSQPGTHVGVGVSIQGPLAMLSVADQGEGIPTDKQEQVFKRFYRVDTDRSRRSGGTGLGLSIARNTARALRGDVTLWSQVGVGSTFTLKLPLAEEAPA